MGKMNADSSVILGNRRPIFYRNTPVLPISERKQVSYQEPEVMKNMPYLASNMALNKNRDISSDGSSHRKYKISLPTSTFPHLNLNNSIEKPKLFKRESVASMAAANILKQRRLRMDSSSL